MENKTIQRIIGIFITIALIIILLPLLLGKKDDTQTAAINEPTFPDQQQTQTKEAESELLTRPTEQKTVPMANNEGMQTNDVITDQHISSKDKDPTPETNQSLAQNTNKTASQTPAQKITETDSQPLPQNIDSQASTQINGKTSVTQSSTQTNVEAATTQSSNQMNPPEAASTQAVTQINAAEATTQSATQKNTETASKVSSKTNIDAANQASTKINANTQAAIKNKPEVMTQASTQKTNEIPNTAQLKPSEASSNSSVMEIKQPNAAQAKKPLINQPEQVASHSLSTQQDLSSQRNDIKPQNISIISNKKEIATNDETKLDSVIEDDDEASPSTPEKNSTAHRSGQTASAAHAKEKHFLNLKKTVWAVQLGSFKDKNNARKLADKLRAAGYKAFTREIKSAKGMNVQIRVYIGPEYKQASAIKLTEKLEQQMKLHGFLVPYKPLEI